MRATSGPKKTQPSHVEVDPKTGKFIVSRRVYGVEPLLYDTLQEALAAASNIEQVRSS